MTPSSCRRRTRPRRYPRRGRPCVSSRRPRIRAGFRHALLGLAGGGGGAPRGSTSSAGGPGSTRRAGLRGTGCLDWRIGRRLGRWTHRRRERRLRGGVGRGGPPGGGGGGGRGG